MSPLRIFNKKMKEEKMKTQVWCWGFLGGGGRETWFEATAAASRDLTTEQALSLVDKERC